MERSDGYFRGIKLSNILKNLIIYKSTGRFPLNLVNYLTTFVTSTRFHTRVRGFEPTTPRGSILTTVR